MQKHDNVIERTIEGLMFQSRWLLAPMYVGLIAVLALLIVKFFQELWVFAPLVLNLAEPPPESTVILNLLTLVDLALAGNLLVMVIFSGYESFVSKIDTGDNPDRPNWMGKVDFGGLKLKLVASIVAISGIHLLKAFMDIDSQDKDNLFWLVIVHMAFVVSGVLLALMDLIASKAKEAKYDASGD
jgi:uncharacterized protein (TIGR00645 family)